VTRILIVEDNESLALGLARSLEAAGFAAEILADGTAVLPAVSADPPALIVLDLTLPGRSGFAILRDLRARGLGTPVLILSARGQEAEKVQGFRLGADDYVVKPVGVLELIARVEAILRRSGTDADAAAPPDSDAELPETVGFGDVEVNTRRHVVTRSGEAVDLSPLEYELLICLLRRDGGVVDRASLLTEVWGYKVPVPTRTVDTHVGNLRAKLEEDPSRPRHIVTVRKVGYRLDR
jgi:DNA-binding response OmpR family regulator